MDNLAVRPKPGILKNCLAEGQLKFELWFLLAPLLSQFLSVNPQYFYIYIFAYEHVYFPKNARGGMNLVSLKELWIF